MNDLYDVVNEHTAELQRLRAMVRRLLGGQQEQKAVVDGLMERANVLGAELQRLNRAAVELPATRKRGGR